VWLACASLLLHTAVPSNLHLPHVDTDAVFGKRIVHEAAYVERFFLATWAVEQVVLLVTLWLYARRGARFTAESAAGPIGTGMLLGMLGLGIVWLVQLPFTLLDVWWARRHGLTESGYVEWALGHWVELGASFVAICIALLVVMFLARRLGEIWWIPGAACFVAIGAFFAFVQPYLVTDTKPVRDPVLKEAAREFEREQGVSHVPVSVEDVSGTTSQANAYAVGFGPSRKVVLWSTMVDGRFTTPEVKVVLAHEIGHHSSDHIPKAIAWFGLFALPGAWILMRATRGRGGMGEAAAVPLALFVVAAFQLAVAPAQAWISRRMEAEADWKALQTTHDPAGARGLFVGFAHTDLANPDPPTWAHVLLDSHPTLDQRVAMVEAWRARRRETVSETGRSLSPTLLPAGDRLKPVTDATSMCTRGRSRPRAASAGRRGP
jgi:STE24 endopeptidase